jgi:urea transporter
MLLPSQAHQFHLGSMASPKIPGANKECPKESANGNPHLEWVQMGVLDVVSLAILIVGVLFLILIVAAIPGVLAVCPGFLSFLIHSHQFRDVPEDAYLMPWSYQIC